MVQYCFRNVHIAKALMCCYTVLANIFSTQEVTYYMNRHKLFNIEYSGLQGLYWMAFGIIISFAAVFLHARGYSNAELGAIMAAGNICALILQPLVADFADRSKRVSILGIIAAVAGILCLSFVTSILVPGRSALISLSYGAFICCIFLMQPLVTSVSSFIESRNVKINFGIARGIGSLGYAVLVAILGVLVERLSTLVLPVAGLCVMLCMLALLAVLARQCRGASSTVSGSEAAESRSSAEFLKSDKRFALMLAGLALMYFSHAVINNFLINIVENLGGNNADMGALNAYTAIIEMPAMFFFALLLRRWSCSSLFRFSIAMYAAKAFAVYFAPNLPLLYAAQILQSVSFALYIPASVRYVQETVPPADQIKGQAFVTSMISLSSIFASFLGGIMYDAFGVGTTLLIAAAVTTVGAAITVPAVRKTPFSHEKAKEAAL